MCVRGLEFAEGEIELALTDEAVLRLMWCSGAAAAAAPPEELPDEVIFEDEVGIPELPVAAGDVMSGVLSFGGVGGKLKLEDGMLCAARDPAI